MNRAMSEAIREVQSYKSCGCVFCDLGFATFKLKRRTVHHFPDTGQIVVCEVAELKPAS